MIRKVKLIAGLIGLVIFAAIMVPPWLREHKQSKERGEALAQIESELRPLVDQYEKLDVRSAKRGDPTAAIGRKAMVIDFVAHKLADSPSPLDDTNLARARTEVGLVFLYRKVKDPKPSITYEGGGKGYGAIVYLVAVTHPEGQIVDAREKWFPPPKSTIGLKGTGQSFDIDAIIPPQYVSGVVAELVKRPR
jgi:hypothetical protein